MENLPIRDRVRLPLWDKVRMMRPVKGLANAIKGRMTGFRPPCLRQSFQLGRNRPLRLWTMRFVDVDAPKAPQVLLKSGAVQLPRWSL